MFPPAKRSGPKSFHEIFSQKWTVRNEGVKGAREGKGMEYVDQGELGACKASGVSRLSE